MKNLRNLSLGAAALVLATTTFAQNQPGSVHGTVNNAAGQQVKEGTVKLSTDRAATDDKTRKYQYTGSIGSDGSYKITGVAPGDYVLFYQVNDKTIDYLEHVVVKSGEDVAANDYMTREDYMKHLSPEERKQIEDFKKKNAEAVNANKTVANLNTLLTKARDEEKAKNYQAAVDDMKQATTQKADEAILWLELGNSQLGLADGTKKASDYSDAIASFQKAIDLNAASKKPTPSFAAAAYNGIGQAYGKTGKGKEAVEAFDKAAAAEPAKAGMYYFNGAVVLKNAGDDSAATEADKAIAADPTKADAYYIKGGALIAKSTVDSKSGKIIPPPGCAEAYAKYLELAPDGRFAPEVKQIMAGFDEKVVSSYKAGRKK